MGKDESGLHGSKKPQQVKEIVWMCLERERHCKTNKLNSSSTETMLADKMFFRCAFGLGRAIQHFCLLLEHWHPSAAEGTWGKEAGWRLAHTNPTKTPAAEDIATKWIKERVSRRMVFLACFAFIVQNESVTWWEMRLKKQLPNTKPKVLFLNVYLLFNFYFCLKFLSRTLFQTRKDDIACFEGFLEKV